MLPIHMVSEDGRPYNPNHARRTDAPAPKLSRASSLPTSENLQTAHCRAPALYAIAASIIFANSALGLMPMVRDTT